MSLKEKFGGENMYELILGLGMGFKETPAQQMKIAKSVGWDGIFTGWSKSENLEEYAKCAQEQGLIYQSVHAPFGNVDKIWESETEGDRYAEEQIECLRQSCDVGVNLVVAHAIIGMERCTPTALGLKRFEKIFNAAENLGVTVALENTEGEIYVEALMKEFGSSDRVRFCIDTGHEMCYNASRDIIGKYAEKLICTHLNDNMGQTGESITWLDDSHLLPFDGVGDWNGIAQRLKKAGYQNHLTFELTSKSKPERNTHDIYAHLDCEGFVALALERARKFRNIIEAK